MGDNVLETVQKLLQDVIAPDVRELKVRVDAAEKQIELLHKEMEERFKAADQREDERFKAAEQRNDERFKAAEQRNDAMFKAVLDKMESNQAVLLAAFGEFKATKELTLMRELAELRSRVAAMEIQLSQLKVAA